MIILKQHVKSYGNGIRTDCLMKIGGTNPCSLFYKNDFLKIKIGYTKYMIVKSCYFNLKKFKIWFEFNPFHYIEFWRQHKK